MKKFVFGNKKLIELLTYIHKISEMEWRREFSRGVIK